MAGVHRIPDHDMGVSFHCHVHEPRAANCDKDGLVLHPGWRIRHYPCLRHHAKQNRQRPCEQFLRVEGLGKPDGLVE